MADIILSDAQIEEISHEMIILRSGLARLQSDTDMATIRYHSMCREANHRKELIVQYATLAEMRKKHPKCVQLQTHEQELRRHLRKTEEFYENDFIKLQQTSERNALLAYMCVLEDKCSRLVGRATVLRAKVDNGVEERTGSN